MTMFRPTLRLLSCLAALASLAACSSGPRIAATDEAAEYARHARRSYTAPGPASDPWGPYIIEAAGKYDVPERWVREVVRQESGGRQYENGKLIISSAGAMGLMQVMPATYDELRARYHLGDDPYEPHDNIMAGTAYLRELYDVYGSPGFLAAYNAGPGRLDDYLTRHRALPDETRRYVARIGANIGDSQPERVSTNAQYAMNALPINIPAGPRNPRGRVAAPVALADNRPSRGSYDRATVVQLASLPQPPAYVAPAPTYTPVPAASFAAATVPARRPGFHLIPQALADTIPTQRGGTTVGTWAIQVGAFGNESLARAATDSARHQASDALASSRPAIGSVRSGSATLFRARLTGISRDAAVQACERIAHSRGNCIVLSPGAQT